MDDDDLFDGPSLNARSTDPWTSHAGAAPAAFKITDLMKVWGIYRDSYPRPLADYQMEDIIGRGPLNGKYRKRRSDLKTGHILVDSGIALFCVATRKQQIVWAINPTVLVDGKPPFACPKRLPAPSPYDDLDG